MCRQAVSAAPWGAAKECRLEAAAESAVDVHVTEERKAAAQKSGGKLEMPNPLRRNRR
jgi:hypothetical protein